MLSSCLGKAWNKTTIRGKAQELADPCNINWYRIRQDLLYLGLIRHDSISGDNVTKVRHLFPQKQPLYALLKKDAKFYWTEKCQESFDCLKKLLVTAPVLAYPQFQSLHPFILETDASTEGLGAVATPALDGVSSAAVGWEGPPNCLCLEESEPS